MPSVRWFANLPFFLRSGSAAFMEGPKKDTRPIKDKHWQAEKSSELIEFLIAANYNHHISPKILQNPTRKDFECIFQVRDTAMQTPPTPHPM